MKYFIYFLIISFFIFYYNLAHSFEISLAWDPNQEPELAGYKVYYGKASRNYAFTFDVGKHERVTIAGLEYGTTYYFAVTAYDIYQNESSFSREVTYKAAKIVTNKTPWIPLLLLDD